MEGDESPTVAVAERKPKLRTMRKAAEFYRRLLLTKDKKPEYFAILSEKLKAREFDAVNELISLMTEHGETKLLLRQSAEEETILHSAVKLRTPPEVVSSIVDCCPALLLEGRNSSELYRGQTALHIAVTVRNLETVELIIQQANKLGVNQKHSLLHSLATGSRFDNTVMLGELPLSVAALTFNSAMIDALLAQEAELDRQNSVGDNVVHSLIRYTYLYPEKLTDVMKMLEYIASIAAGDNAAWSSSIDSELKYERDMEKRFAHIWMMHNAQGLNPLQLAAHLGQQIIFKFIMDLKGIYCFVNSEDGLFDVKMYDVTEIDYISTLKTARVGPAPEHALERSGTGTGFSRNNSNVRMDAENQGSPKPTLEMIFNSDPVTISKLIQFSPLNYVVNRKWNFYRWFYTIWGILHMLFMIGYTVFAVRRSELDLRLLDKTNAYASVNKIGEDVYVTLYTVLSLVFAAVYFIQEVVRIVRGRMPWSVSHVINCYHNGPFRLMLLAFSVTVMADFLWKMLDDHYENYLLVVAMILGWWFIVFFLRAYRQFSFFTVMIQKVLVGDMFRFSIIIGMELVAFTTAMYIAFRGSSAMLEDVQEYGRLMLFMFKMMFGFTSIEVLFEARQPWFAVLLYTAFVLLTYVLMINSLIAMMSNTCSFVSQNRDIQWRVQQLSVVLFFESIFPSCCLHLVGQPRSTIWYDTAGKQYLQRRRYYMEVRSLHEVTKSKSRLRMTSESMLETIFNTLTDKDIFGSKPSSERKPVERSVIDGAIPVTESRDVSNKPVRGKKKKKKNKRKHSDEEDTAETHSRYERFTTTVPEAMPETEHVPEVYSNPIMGNSHVLRRESTLEIHNFSTCGVCDSCSSTT